MVLENSSNLRLWIAEGLLVENNKFWSTDILKRDFLLFKRWYAKRRQSAWYAWMWFFDRGKLVIEYHSQVIKVVTKERNRIGKLIAHPTITSSFKQNFKIS